MPNEHSDFPIHCRTEKIIQLNQLFKRFCCSPRGGIVAFRKPPVEEAHSDENGAHAQTVGQETPECLDDDSVGAVGRQGETHQPGKPGGHGMRLRHAGIRVFAHADQAVQVRGTFPGTGNALADGTLHAGSAGGGAAVHAEADGVGVLVSKAMHGWTR